MKNTACPFFKQEIFAMPVTESVQEIDEYKIELMGFGSEAFKPPQTLSRKCVTYPSTYPTIDITAADRVYRSLAVNHDSVSGNTSINHS